MTLFSNNRLNLWKEKVFWYLQRLTTKISRSFQTCSNAVWIGVVTVFAGAEGKKCDITGGLKINTPASNRGIYQAWSLYE
jgi:hypothetical protein